MTKGDKTVRHKLDTKRKVTQNYLLPRFTVIFTRTFVSVKKNLSPELLNSSLNDIFLTN